MHKYTKKTRVLVKSTHIQVYKYIYKYISTQLQQNASTQACRYKRIQVNKYTIIQINKYTTSIQVHNYTSTKESSFAIYLYVWNDGRYLKFTKWPQFMRQQLGQQQLETINNSEWSLTLDLPSFSANPCFSYLGEIF